MSRGPDIGTLLQRALLRDAAAAGCNVTIADAETTRWASATFAGARHRIVLAGPDDAALAAWLGGAAEADLPVRGHLVADLIVAAVARRDGAAEVAIEALTVEV